MSVRRRSGDGSCPSSDSASSPSAAGVTAYPAAARTAIVVSRTSSRSSTTRIRAATFPMAASLPHGKQAESTFVCTINGRQSRGYEAIISCSWLLSQCRPRSPNDSRFVNRVSGVCKKVPRLASPTRKGYGVERACLCPCCYTRGWAWAPPGIQEGRMRQLRTILFVEDDTAVRDVVIRILSEKGFGVLTAGAAYDATRILPERPGDPPFPAFFLSAS